MKPPRRINPNPADPDWKYPYASRRAIENLEKYFAHFKGSNGGWKQQQKEGIPTTVFSNSRRSRIRWESVQPHLRDRCEQQLSQKIAEERAKGRPGWPTAGKIRSLMGNITRNARYCWSGKLYLSLSMHNQRRNRWLLYLDWKAKEERRELVGPMPRKVLEVSF